MQDTVENTVIEAECASETCTEFYVVQEDTGAGFFCSNFTTYADALRKLRKAGVEIGDVEADCSRELVSNNREVVFLDRRGTRYHLYRSKTEKYSMPECFVFERYGLMASGM